MATRAARRTSSRAVAKPIPLSLPQPVMSAVRSVKSKGVFVISARLSDRDERPRRSRQGRSAPLVAQLLKAAWSVHAGEHARCLRNCAAPVLGLSPWAEHDPPLSVDVDLELVTRAKSDRVERLLGDCHLEFAGNPGVASPAVLLYSCHLSKECSRSRLPDGCNRVDDHRHVQWGRALPWRRPCVTSRLAPQLDDQIAEAVRDGGVLSEAGLAVDVTDGSNPFGHPIQLSEVMLEGCQHREAR